MREGNDLLIQLDDQGDAYVSVVPEGWKIGPTVRLCASGGASSMAPGLLPAIRAAYEAIKAGRSGAFQFAGEAVSEVATLRQALAQARDEGYRARAAVLSLEQEIAGLRARLAAAEEPEKAGDVTGRAAERALIAELRNREPRL